MAKTQKISMIPLVAGLFLIILVFGSGEGRLARPEYDGDGSDFSLRLLDTQEEAVRGDPYWIEVMVENEENDEGKMFVQCSLLDFDKHITWLPDVGLQATVTPEDQRRQSDNCVAHEPFTQTAEVELEPNEPTKVTFNVLIPNDYYNKDIVIFCDAFEQCSSDGSIYSSSSFRHPINILEEATPGVTDEDGKKKVITDLPSEACNRDSDCSGSYWGDVECYQGLCLDKKNVPGECGDGRCSGDETQSTCPEDCGLSDLKLKEWIDEHRILVAGIAMGLVIIGIFGIRPKKNILNLN